LKGRPKIFGPKIFFFAKVRENHLPVFFTGCQVTGRHGLRSSSSHPIQKLSFLVRNTKKYLNYKKILLFTY